MRTTAVLTTLALSGALLSGCGGGSNGGSSTSGYCDELKAAKAQFSSLNSGSPDFSKFSEALATFHKIAGDAPSAVAADWKQLDEALTKFQDALKAAGLTFEDFGAISTGNLPPGMTQAQMQAALPKIQAAVSTLSTGDLQKASSAIEKHAKTECKIDLTTS